MSVEDVLSSLPALGRRGFLNAAEPKDKEDKVLSEIQAKVLNKLKDTEAIKQEKWVFSAPASGQWANAKIYMTEKVYYM